MYLKKYYLFLVIKNKNYNINLIKDILYKIKIVKIIKIELLGLKNMAYKVKNNKKAIYMYINLVINKNHINLINYLNYNKNIIRFLFKKKNIIIKKKILIKFIDKNCKILSSKFTKISFKFQKKIANSIKIARFLTILPYKLK
ncbi:30S ribosomal protein S6 [Candidatus Vidania fulgoroideorum]